MSKNIPYTTIKEMEVYIIKKAISKYTTRKTAAKFLGITEKTLYNKINQYDLK